MRDNIYDLLSVKPSLGTSDITKLVHYLKDSRNLFLNDTDKNVLFKERTMLTSPLAKTYSRYIDEDCFDYFSLIVFPSRTNLNIPNNLTFRHLVLDMEQMADADSSIRNTVRADNLLNNRLVSNISQLVRTDGRYYYLKDQDRFQSNIVRDCLSRSYYANRHKSSWLRSSISLSVAKVYALLLSSNIARWADLGMGEQDYLTIVFASFILGMLTDDKGAEGLLSTRYREFYLRDRILVMDTLKSFKETISTSVPRSLDDCFTLINTLGIERLRLSSNGLASKLRTISDDTLTTAISLEYPPYFLWSILNALSGSKNQLHIFIKNQNLMKDLQRAMGELIHSVPSIE